ncbi:MAG: glycosyltransferase 87 family protein [Actinobacteria bacterium]|nr:glycosyltransferase 87 family protein [Actinomycetota bacterium]
MAETVGRQRWWLFAAALAVTLGVLWAGFLAAAAVASGENTDFMVYRGSVQSMLEGGSLYDFLLTGHTAQDLGFTYPPFAGVFLAWIGVLPLSAALLVWSLVQLASCVALAAIVVRLVPGAGGSSWPTIGVAASALVVSEPVSHGISIGQVSLVMVLLVVADVVVPARWRGVLTGVAAAVKLIPLVFLPYYLLTRQWRAARNLGLGFAAATGVAWLLLPADSLQYWTDLVLRTGRVGEASARRNASLLGLLSHAGLTGTALTLVWLGLGAVVCVLAFRRAVRHHRRGEELAAILVVGVLSAVISPISWPHHLVWAPLAALYLVRGGPRWARVAGVVLWLAYLVNTPLMGFDDTAPDWLRWPEALISLSLVALAVLGLPGSAAGDAPPVREPERARPEAA